MRFLSFLKKGKSGEGEGELEAPPAPPLTDFSPELPSLPEKNEEEGLLAFQSEELPSFPKKGKELPPFPTESPEQELPPFPELKPKEALKPLEEVLLPKWKKTPLILEGEEFEYAAVKEEENIVHAREKLTLEKPVFVEGRNFQKILTSVGYLRSMLQEGEEHVTHWSHLEQSKDTHFEHIKTGLEHIQRKLIYIDKTLFER